jgi:hypothetical protein
MDMKTSPLSLLNDPSLLKTDALINGQWVKGASRFDVHDPATGAKLADVANLGAAEAEAAIAAADAAWPAWRTKTGKERSALLRKWFDLLMANQDDLGRLMTAEQGKPLAEAKGEVAYGASFVEWYAEEAKRVNGETLPQFDNNRRLLVLRQPIGVCAAITPWNFPLAMITRKVAPRAGCWLPGGDQARRTHAAHRTGRGRTGATRRHPGGCAQRAHRRQRQQHRRRQGVLRQRHGAPYQLHRQHRGGPHPDGAKRAVGEEALARTGWQRALHRV